MRARLWVLVVVSEISAGCHSCADTIHIGTAIERASSAAALLEAAARIPAAGPTFAQPHLKQDVHQIKRQQLACNALSKLARLLIGSGVASERRSALSDLRMGHLISCIAAESSERPDGLDASKDEQSARAVVQSLSALASLYGEDAAAKARQRPAQAATADAKAAISVARKNTALLVSRADGLSPSMGLSDAATARWTSRRLLGSRAPTTPNLDEACCELPFDLLPGLVAFSPEDHAGATNPTIAAMVAELPSVEALSEEVPFQQQELLTADGSRVRERRHTAWLADDGVGALAYSGKLMAPAPMVSCPTVMALREALERDTGERFDCALCNFYPAGGEAACKWHTDPEHGTKWHRTTTVVSIGEARRFSFRAVKRPGVGHDASADLGALYWGDVVVMRDHCNDAFEHAVMPAQGAANRGPRVSLVFKRALADGNGRKGHSLAGEGRRYRARRRQEAAKKQPR